MAGEDVLVNMTGVISSLPQYVIGRFGSLIIVLQAIGIVFIVYVIYVIFNMFLGFKSRKRMKVLIKKVDVIDKKLNILIKGKEKDLKKEKKSKK